MDHLVDAGNEMVVMWFDTWHSRPSHYASSHSAVLLQADSGRDRWYTKSPFISGSCSIAHVRGTVADNAL
jgi:hypothetical protein